MHGLARPVPALVLSAVCCFLQVQALDITTTLLPGRAASGVPTSLISFSVRSAPNDLCSGSGAASATWGAAADNIWEGDTRRREGRQEGGSQGNGGAFVSAC